MVAPTALDALIERYGLDLHPEDILAEWEAALRLLPGPDAAPLTGPEIEFLAQHSGPAAEIIIDNWTAENERRERASTVMRSVEILMSESLTPAEVARRLGVDRSQISRRISKHSLYAFTAANGYRRLPSWQFVGDRPLPGLDVVVPAIPVSLAPMSVRGFMLTPHGELGEQTPVAFLARGGSPSTVARLIEALDRW